ncbi:MAG TPA: hypothetical protein VEX86_06620 [Longimicrobium sp.]|nr:hypothetical protein [Longimicrobium sp.]
MYRLMPFTRRVLTAAAVVSSLAGAPAILAAQGACSAGEVTLRAGDPRLAGISPLPLDSMEMSMEREGANRSFGTYTQHVQRASVNGAPAHLFVQRAATPRGTSLDSIWVDARSWVSLRHVAATPGGGMNVTFQGGRVTGRVTEGDSARQVDAEVPAGSFDYSVGSAAVKGIPLCEGAVIRVAGYDPMRGPRETIYRILRAERVEIGGAPRDVWTADVQVGDRTVRMHLDRATGRELDWSIAGPNGATMRGTSRIFTTR